MKTIKEIIEKWDEMYELVMVGTADANNSSWHNLQDVFMLPDAAMDEAKEKVRELCDEWNNLTEDDIMQGEKDWPLVMKFIGDMLVMSASRYPFYIYKGEVGILAYVDDDIIKGHNLTEYGGIAFVPGYDLEVIPDKDCGACVTYDDCYGEYSNCVEIDNHTIVNVENEQKLSYEEWVSDMYAESDEYVRQLLTCTNSYYDWTSRRTDMINYIETEIRVFDEGFSAIDESDDEKINEAKSSLKKWLCRYKQEWEETVNEYSDPKCFADSKKETADFLSVLNDVVIPDDLYDETYQVVGEFRREIEKEQTL